VAKKLVPEIGQQLGLVPHILGTISGEQLAQEGRFYYKNAMYNDLAQPILAANFVKDDVGTGLVHLSYAHGHEDYQVWLFSFGNKFFEHSPIPRRNQIGLRFTFFFDKNFLLEDHLKITLKVLIS
jgi:hypothetical protein